ncbi:MAG TPA: SDR family oxidoreductase [Candidatus Limnocylindrales bacterium]|nr:SDR family oxidoreductase [Candidatus Limnocylindrales bacterium]
MRLVNKVALITGGGTGIGRATAELFAQEGAKVAISGRRKEKLEEAVTAITLKGGEAIAIPGDVTRQEDTQRMVRETVARWERLDILVNNAGAVDRTKMMESTLENWDRIMDINVKGVFLTSRSVIPQMIKQGGGSIVNVSSVAGLRGGLPDAPSYSAAKAAVITLTKTMAVDFARYRIRVNAVLPSLVETDVARTRVKPGQTWEEIKEKLIPLYPLGRLGTPEDIAQGILYLASDAAAWVTGIELIIDGGFTAKLYPDPESQ